MQRLNLVLAHLEQHHHLRLLLASLAKFSKQQLLHVPPPLARESAVVPHAVFIVVFVVSVLYPIALRGAVRGDGQVLYQWAMLWQKFSKVSALVHLLYVKSLCTGRFENFLPLSMRAATKMLADVRGESSREFVSVEWSVESSTAAVGSHCCGRVLTMIWRCTRGRDEGTSLSST
jgi:predicted RNA-binding Zn-ribbon protein involved in translation (DUF1610 family)